MIDFLNADIMLAMCATIAIILLVSVGFITKKLKWPVLALWTPTVLWLLLTIISLIMLFYLYYVAALNLPAFIVFIVFLFLLWTWSFTCALTIIIFALRLCKKKSCKLLL